MPVITAAATSSHQLHGAQFTSLASPSLGSAENSVWRLSPRCGGDPGRAQRHPRRDLRDPARPGHRDARRRGASPHPGATLVLPPHVRFSLQAHGPEPLEAIVCLPVGGQAMMSSGASPSPRPGRADVG